MVVLLSLQRFLGSIFWSLQKVPECILDGKYDEIYVNGVCFGLPRSTVFISHNSFFFHWQFGGSFTILYGQVMVEEGIFYIILCFCCFL